MHELRCPTTGRLYGRLAIEDQPRVVDGTEVEVACRDCRRAIGAARVLHRWNVAGEHTRTFIVRPGGTDEVPADDWV